MSRTNALILLRRYRFLLLLMLVILFLLAAGIVPPTVDAIGLVIILISIGVLELRRRLLNRLVRGVLLITLIASWSYALVLAFLLFMSGGVIYPGAAFAGAWVDSYGLHMRLKVPPEKIRVYDYYEKQIAQLYLMARYWPNVTTQPEIWCEFADPGPSAGCTFQRTTTTFGPLMTAEEQLYPAFQCRFKPHSGTCFLTRTKSRSG